MYERRGGVEYFRSLKELEKDKRKSGLTSALQYATNITMRFVQCVIARGNIRRIVYQKILRK